MHDEDDDDPDFGDEADDEPDDEIVGQLEDRELPDRSDMDSFDEPSLDACPYCRKMISEDAERCHHCGQYINQEDAPRQLQAWMWVGIILLGISFVVWMFISGKWL
jgi:predicted nucleic acid-binding Zn ribbon protein